MLSDPSFKHSEEQFRRRVQNMDQFDLVLPKIKKMNNSISCGLTGRNFITMPWECIGRLIDMTVHPHFKSD